MVKVDGEAVRSWNELRWDLLRQAADRAQPEVLVRDAAGAERRVRLDLGSVDTDRVDGDFLARIGIQPGDAEPVARELTPGMPAQQVGLQVGDRIVNIEGTAVASVTDIQRIVGAAAGKPLRFEVERETARLQLVITPSEVRGAAGAPVGRIGVGFRNTLRVRDTPLPALTHAVGRTWQTSIFSLRMLGRMIVGRASLQNLSGPVTIADAAGQSARIGPMAYLGFLALVSISLGVMNLLPVPVLDGGHLLYYAIEVVKGSPPSASWLELGQRMGIGLLVVLTALALYNDLTRLLFQ